MTQVMGIQPTKELKAPKGRKKFNLSFLRPFGACSSFLILYPRLAPWATFLRPFGALAVGYIPLPFGALCVCASCLREILYNVLAFEDDFGDGVLAGM